MCVVLNRNIWLVEQITEVTGIRKELMKTFGGNRGMTDSGSRECKIY